MSRSWRGQPGDKLAAVDPNETPSASAMASKRSRECSLVVMVSFGVRRALAMLPHSPPRTDAVRYRRTQLCHRPSSRSPLGRPPPPPPPFVSCLVHAQGRSRTRAAKVKRCKRATTRAQRHARLVSCCRIAGPPPKIRSCKGSQQVFVAVNVPRQRQFSRLHELPLGSVMQGRRPPTNGVLPEAHG